jgi:trans-aconitate methyltransferase
MTVIIEDIIGKQMVDLGAAGDPRFAGVLVPFDEREKSSFGVTRQFLEDAATYHQKYFNVGYSRYLIDGALEAIGDFGKARLILDIGSGSGPSVLALMDRFPEAHIVATDVSPNLLAILRIALTERGQIHKCTTVCLDLNRPWFKGQPFDLAIGSAIFHHLIEPNRLIEEVFTVLRPGAAAAFFGHSSQDTR